MVVEALRRWFSRISNNCISFIILSSASDDVLSVETSANEPSSENESNSNTLTIGSNDLINILIKFVNEKEMRVQARPEDTILVLKRTHFATELNSNKIGK